MRSTTRRAVGSAALAASTVLLLGACATGSGTSTGATTASPVASGAPSGAPSVTASAVAQGSTGTEAAQSGGCRNLVATAKVKAEVTRAYEAESHRGHITPRPHQFLYGQCGGTTYAATAFDLTPGATYNDQVAAQDDGSTRKYFSLTAGGTWTVIGSANFPDLGGCIPKIPHALATLWGGCKPSQP
jgi:hypothetical protein